MFICAQPDPQWRPTGSNHRSLVQTDAIRVAKSPPHIFSVLLRYVMNHYRSSNEYLGVYSFTRSTDQANENTIRYNAFERVKKNRQGGGAGESAHGQPHPWLLRWRSTNLRINKYLILKSGKWNEWPAYAGLFCLCVCLYLFVCICVYVCTGVFVMHVFMGVGNCVNIFLMRVY